MKINKPQHKNILLNSFFIKQEGQYRDGRPTYTAVTYPIEKLAAAGSAKKKILDCVESEEMNDKEVEFTPSEISILKDGFDRMSELGFAADDAEGVISLKAIFDGVDS